MKNRPTVSIVVPTYNASATLAETLESALAQTWRDFEILIVDDGCTDRSPEIYRSFEDPRMRIVAQENRGLAGARNTGIRSARGRYIALLDADDLWHPEKLEKHVAHLESQPHVGVSFAPSEFIDASSRSLDYVQKPRLRDIELFHVLCRNPVGNGSAAVIRREVLDDIEFVHDFGGERGRDHCWFDEAFRQSEDVELWTRIAITTEWVFEGLPETLTLYRVHTGGLSANVEEQYKTWNRLLEKIESYSPETVARFGETARAFQLLYLCRRMVRSRERRPALEYWLRALRTAPRILRHEPARVLSTGAATLLLNLMPRTTYDLVERLAMSAAA